MGHLAPEDIVKYQKRGISTPIFHPVKAYHGGLFGIHLEDSGFGKRRYPRDMRRPPNYDGGLIPTTHKLGRSGKGCGRRKTHEGGNINAVVNQGNFGMG